MINKKLLKKLDKMSKSDLIFICRKLGFTISGNKSKKQLVSILLKPLKRKYKMMILNDVEGCVNCLKELRSTQLLTSTSKDMTIASERLRERERLRKARTFEKNLDYDKLYQLTEDELVNLKRKCDTCHNNLNKREKSPAKDNLTRFFRIMDYTYDDKRSGNLKSLTRYSGKLTRERDEKHMKTIQKLEEDTSQFALLTALEKFEIPPVTKFEIPPVTDEYLDKLLQEFK